MSKIDFSIVTTWEKDKPLQELNRLLDVRARDIGDASTRDLLYATAHTILRSLKPLVKQAKVSKGELRKSYTLEPTGLVMGWAPSAGGKRKMHPHHPFKGDYDPAIRPICLWGGGIPRHRVYVYRATPKYGSKRRTWAKNLHKGHWYIAAFDEGVARKYVEDTLMKRWIAKFSGLARSAILAIRKALAVQSNDPAPVDDVRFFSEDGRSIMNAAAEMARVELRRSGALQELEVRSELSYARAAMQDPNAIEYAMAKAANSIAGYIRSRMGDALNKDYKTPFPEIARGGSYRHD